MTGSMFLKVKCSNGQTIKIEDGCSFENNGNIYIYEKQQKT